METIFWICLFIVIYTFIGYGLVLFLIIKLKRKWRGKKMEPEKGFTPSLTLIVAAYNEAAIIEEKIKNTLSLNYPANQLKIIFVTDGSSDNTPEIIKKFPEITILHKPERSGKINAVHRAMQQVTTEVTVFTDANTFLNKDALLEIAKHYQDPTVGAVSGEKRVQIEENADATAGEGFYWKYESKLKTWDAELYSVVGAAGELFSIKTNLYIPVPPDTVLDDFMISLLIAQKGYRIVYEPKAYASELGSENVTEELKRKIRIAAGGIQSILRLPKLANPFFNPILCFQYISHRVLRWTITPFCMILTLLLNAFLVDNDNTNNPLLMLLLFGQVIFYGLALLGWIASTREIKIKILFIPYYFCMMNYAVIAGIFRYIAGNQSAVWDKAKRKQTG